MFNKFYVLAWHSEHAHHQHKPPIQHSLSRFSSDVEKAAKKFFEKKKNRNYEVIKIWREDKSSITRRIKIYYRKDFAL